MGGLEAGRARLTGEPSGLIRCESKFSSYQSDQLHKWVAIYTANGVGPVHFLQPQLRLEGLEGGGRQQEREKSRSAACDADYLEMPRQ